MSPAVGKMLWSLCPVPSDDLKRELGYYAYDNEIEPTHAKKGAVRPITDLLPHAVYVDDTAATECGRSYVAVLDANDLVMMRIRVSHGP